MSLSTPIKTKLTLSAYRTLCTRVADLLRSAWDLRSCCKREGGIAILLAAQNVYLGGTDAAHGLTALDRL